MNLWKDLIGHEDIGIDDDFFRLGGDSLLAIQIISKIQTAFHVSLGLQALFEYPTIAKLAKAIEEQKAPSSALVQLKAGIGNKPIFFLHPIEGNVLCYRTLAESLKCKCPIYGVKAIHPDAKTIEEIASRYISDIRKIQPSGPYHLLGFSFGGLIAYEIARQLNRRGESIELLLMLDIVRPGHPSLPIGSEEALLHHLAELLEGKPVPMQELHENRLMEIMHLTALPPSEQKLIYEQIKRHLQILSSYKPGSYEGKAVFVQAKDKFFRTKDLCLSSTWNELVKGGIDMYEVSGSHLSMMSSPHVENLANLLDFYLEKKP